MSSNYLLKTEPSEYSFADLQRDKVTTWDGVHNPVALRNLGAMKPGDRLIIYETGDHKSAVGTASVVSIDASNPKNPAVEIKAGKLIAKRALFRLPPNDSFVRRFDTRGKTRAGFRAPPAQRSEALGIQRVVSSVQQNNEQ